MASSRLTSLALAAAFLAAAPAARADKIVVKYRAGAHGLKASAASTLASHTRVLKVRDAATTVQRLRARRDVVYAVPDVKAHAAGFVPNDPGRGTTAGGWTSVQWNFSGPFSVNAPDAWANAINAGAPGGRGVTIAVLDTGVAYSKRGTFRKSPDLVTRRFVKGYDFVSHDNYANDRNGHGTHVASTIAEATNNGIGLTGLAFRAKLMPVRVLDRLGRGRADDITAGIRFATDHKADVINMSFNFGCGKKVPSVAQAIHYATHRGVVVVASVGNLGSESCVSPPATIPGVIGVGGTTEGGCVGNYSLAGEDVDVVAPGGGEPAPTCASVLMNPIFQVTFNAGNERRFGEPSDYIGTSMAAAHVSGVAALVLASGLIDRTKKGGSIQAQVATRLKKTARSLGLSPLIEGAGLIDAAWATDPECQLACFSNRH
jgi:serine protease